MDAHPIQRPLRRIDMLVVTNFCVWSSHSYSYFIENQTTARDVHGEAQVTIKD